MITDQQIREQIPHVLESTDLRLGRRRYEGKVRDSYILGDGRRLLVTTDRLSCFDRVVTSVPFKGQALNELAVHWFALSKGIIPNHVIEVPDPNAILAKECKILPVEIVVRGYLAGSAWRDYRAGKEVSGVRLPSGLDEYARLASPVLTPSTKAEKGAHDLPISESEIVGSGLVPPSVWDRARECALELFRLGQREAERRGLILADTKYELGLDDNGELLLADEIHTLDSSRYWVAATYEEHVSSGRPPEMLDKEPTRQWLLARGFKGDGPIPEITSEHRVQISRHYLDSFARITGGELAVDVGSVSERVSRNLSRFASAGASC